MQLEASGLVLSATDIARHLACRHLTALELAVARGVRPKPPFFHDPQLTALRHRGSEHERAFLDHLRTQGLAVEEMPATEDLSTSAARTRDAIERGVEVIAQGTLLYGAWQGRPDALVKVAAPGSPRGWAYEPYETKLARQTRGGTILQLCLYAELLAPLQQAWPERIHVISPGRGFAPESYRVQEYLAYYRRVRQSLLESAAPRGARPWPAETYPIPCTHCDVCAFAIECDARWRHDDHLCLVAGMRRIAERELVQEGVSTLTALAAWSPDPGWRPERGSRPSYESLQEQAALQLASRELPVPLHTLLPVEPGQGLSRLPEPSAGDLFLDLEADPFWGERGLEYLFGLSGLAAEADRGSWYQSWWAFDRASERRAFENTIDQILSWWRRQPDLHVYHFGHYEPAALRRLSTRHGTREEEIDRLLRAERFVDLHLVVRQSLRAGVESYSLKRLEALYDFRRQAPLHEAGRMRAELAAALELGNAAAISDEDRGLVERYNRDDCFSTSALREWLEARRVELVARGAAVSRPTTVGEGAPSEALGERLARVRAVATDLLAGIPETEQQRSVEQQATWLLAQSLEFHRREQKVRWWEFYRLAELDDTARLEEPCAIAAMSFESRSEDGRGTLPTDRYRFPPQEVDSRARKAYVDAERPLGAIVALDASEGWVEIKKTGGSVDDHPQSVFLFDDIGPKPKDEALLRLGEWASREGIDAAGTARAGRDLLLRRPPRGCSPQDGSLRLPHEDVVTAACRLVRELDRGVLPIQGPPGSGKTYTGARMIVSLVREGRKVGVTALSHKVIGNFLREVVHAAESQGCDVRCLQKVSELSEGARTIPARRKGDRGPASMPQLLSGITETTKNEDVDRMMAAGVVDVLGGTAWLWARADLADSVDVLFVDEAGQMALADVLAASASTRNLVLLGDPRQLEQPIQGAHPDGCDVTALEHLLSAHATVSAERGLFIEHTRRMHPALCRFTSEQFYEGKLFSLPGLEQQALAAPTPFDHSGLFFLPIEHEGCSNASAEEARAVAALIDSWLQAGSNWIDREGYSRRLELKDVLVVAPYNAQVALLRAALPPGASVGTVDKFQGQQAPVVIYSLTTSSPEEAPRGMGFLYSRNRLNVATSRARCACVLVASRRLLSPECRTPAQMRLANALCAYVEAATEVSWRDAAVWEACAPAAPRDGDRPPSAR